MTEQLTQTCIKFASAVPELWLVFITLIYSNAFYVWAGNRESEVEEEVDVDSQARKDQRSLAAGKGQRRKTWHQTLGLSHSDGV